MKAELKKLLGVSTTLCLLSSNALAQSGNAGQLQAPENLAQAESTAARGATATAAAPGDSTGAAKSVTGENQLGEIIVTATRRATSLQTVTATIDVASATKLDALNIKESAGLENLVPGVTVARSGGVTPFIRGIGTFNAGFSEASVGAYIDGIYLPNSTGVLFSFNNIERIEVLKGPQGTLYGRNTTGGLINIITRPPDEQLTVDASLGAANYGTFTQNAYVSGPIADNLTGNIAVYHSKQDKGWSTNLFTGNEVQKSEDAGAYGKLQWKPGSDTKVTLSGLYNYSNSNKGWAFAILPGTFGADGTPYLGEYKISNRADPYAKYEGYLTSLKIDQNLGFADLFSLTGYQYGHQTDLTSASGFPGLPVAGRAATTALIDFNYHTVSQEFQLSSKPSVSPFEWIAGAFFYHDSTNVTQSSTATCVDNLCGSAAPPTFSTTNPTTISSSAYGDGTYKITKATRLTIGLRYTHEIKGFSGLVYPRAGFPTSVAVLPASVIRTPEAAGVPSSLTASKLTYRVVLAQDFTDRIHAYMSYNRGFKSGNFNATNLTNPPVKPEFLNALEVGVKSELLDRKLRLNLSAFRYSYTDIQVRSNTGLPAGATSVSLNVASARTNGIDAQVDFRPIEGLSLSGGYEYLDAKYRDYPGASCSTPRGLPLGGLTSVTCNLAGYPLPVSPRHSLVLGASYQFQTSVGSFTWVLNDSYKSRFTYTSDDSLHQPSTNIVDTSFKWRSLDDKYDVQLFVQNATDKYRYVAGQNGVAYAYVPGQPRTYGLNLGYHLW